MNRNYTLSYWTTLVVFTLLVVLSAHAKPDVNKLTDEVRSRGILGLAALIEAGKLEVPRIESADNPASELGALAFGRELLQPIDATLQKGGEIRVDEIESLLEIGAWLKGEPAYGNLVIAHRAFDVASALTLKALGTDSDPPEEVIALANRIAKTTVEPLYRARVLDEELDTKLFSEQLASVAMEQREQTVRKLWRNLCFLGYSEAIPTLTRELDQAKQSIVQSLGSHADAFLSLGKTVPQSLLAPKTLQYTSNELLENRNLWFVALVSAPENRRSVSFLVDYYGVTKGLPALDASTTLEEAKMAFGKMATDAEPRVNPTVAQRAADVIFSVKAGLPLDGDAPVKASSGP